MSAVGVYGSNMGNDEMTSITMFPGTFLTICENINFGNWATQNWPAGYGYFVGNWSPNDKASSIIVAAYP